MHCFKQKQNFVEFVTKFVVESIGTIWNLKNVTNNNINQKLLTNKLSLPSLSYIFVHTHNKKLIIKNLYVMKSKKLVGTYILNRFVGKCSQWNHIL